MSIENDKEALSASFNVLVRSKASFEQTVNLLKQAIAAEKMLLIHEIHVQKILASHGISIDDTKQLLYFHPQYMQQILAVDNSAVIEAPLKFVVMETGPQATTVRYIRPSYLFGRYPGLEGLGQELEPLVERIVSTLPHE